MMIDVDKPTTKRKISNKVSQPFHLPEEFVCETGLEIMEVMELDIGDDLLFM
jgi:hypothetical protein